METKLKFRVWRRKEGWIKGYEEALKFFHGFSNVNFEDKNLILSFWEEPDGYYKIVKFTGLFDINNNEIYEGDIVKWQDSENPERIARVEWFNGEIHFYRINNKQFPNEKLAMNDFNMGNFIYSDTNKFLEVIGNVFENPELLREVAQ